MECDKLVGVFFSIFFVFLDKIGVLFNDIGVDNDKNIVINSENNEISVVMEKEKLGYGFKDKIEVWEFGMEIN